MPACHSSSFMTAVHVIFQAAYIEFRMAVRTQSINNCLVMLLNVRTNKTLSPRVFSKNSIFLLPCTHAL